MQEQQFTNTTGVPLSIAVWLAHDDYDYIEEQNYISATELIKSPRQIILGQRVAALTGPQEMEDISSAMARALGSSVHNSIEHAWVEKYKTSMLKLGYPRQVIDRVRVNPAPEELTTGIIPVYLEQRAFRTVGKYRIGGKYDFIGDGVLDDFKTTGVYSYMSGSNDWKYKLQGSIYRWLNPELITSDHMNIQFVFTDWSRRDAIMQAAKGYPPTRIFQYKVRLMSVPETEVYIKQRLALLDSLETAAETDLPLCEAQDLWQDPPAYKYYKNPEGARKGARSTKNFTTAAEAQIRLIEDGHVGVVVESPGQVKACKFCSCAGMCSQRDSLVASGALKL